MLPHRPECWFVLGLFALSGCDAVVFQKLIRLCYTEFGLQFFYGHAAVLQLTHPFAVQLLCVPRFENKLLLYPALHPFWSAESFSDVAWPCSNYPNYVMYLAWAYQQSALHMIGHSFFPTCMQSIQLSCNALCRTAPHISFIFLLKCGRGQFQHFSQAACPAACC